MPNERHLRQEQYSGESRLRKPITICQCRVCTNCKYMGFHPRDLNLPIPALKWPCGKGGTDRRKNHRKGNRKQTRPLPRYSGVSYNAIVKLRKITCATTDEQTVEVNNAGNAHIAATGCRKSGSHPPAFQREIREVKEVLRPKRQSLNIHLG